MKYFSNILSLILTLAAMAFAFIEAWPGAFVAAMGAILLALFDIEGAIRAAAKAKDKDPITTEEVRQRLSGLANRPPPPKRPVNPFKIGDRVRRKSDGKEGFVVMTPSDDVFVVDLRIVGLERYAIQFPEEIELISEKARFNPGDRVRITGPQGGAVGTVSSILGSVVLVKFDPMRPYFHGDEILIPSDSLELICEKQL